MEPAFANLPAILKALGPNEAVTRALAISQWSKVAGETLAQRAKAIDFAGGRLIVAVADATWQQNLEGLAPELVAKLNRKLGDGVVRFIEFRIQSR